MVLPLIGRGVRATSDDINNLINVLNGDAALGGELILPHVVTPDVPGVNKTIVYAKSDGALYYRAGSGGAETPVGGSGAAAVADPPTSDTQITAESLAKFWVRVSSAASIIASYNVSSCTDNGTGDVTITVNRDFSAVGAVVATAFNTAARINAVFSVSAGEIRVKTWDAAGVAAGSEIGVVGFGGLV
jgi:hypothetical protein